jgi:hypothetical protein
MDIKMAPTRIMGTSMIAPMPLLARLALPLARFGFKEDVGRRAKWVVHGRRLN